MTKNRTAAETLSAPISLPISDSLFVTQSPNSLSNSCVSPATPLLHHSRSQTSTMTRANRGKEAIQM